MACCSRQWCFFKCKWQFYSVADIQVYFEFWLLKVTLMTDVPCSNAFIYGTIFIFPVFLEGKIMTPLFSLKIVTAHGLIYSSILNKVEGCVGLPPSAPKRLLCL
ncbi:UNVERIFIED_CONTAM: hypothetical protein K2H54_074349 [Gekko kuhli]